MFDVWLKSEHNMKSEEVCIWRRLRWMDGTNNTGLTQDLLFVLCNSVGLHMDSPYQYLSKLVYFWSEVLRGRKSLREHLFLRNSPC